VKCLSEIVVIIISMGGSEGCVDMGEDRLMSQCAARGTKDKTVTVVHITLGAT
jgi:hypothetical protein